MHTSTSGRGGWGRCLRSVVPGPAVFFLLGSGPAGVSHEILSADTALPALVQRICSAKSVKVDYVVRHSVERAGTLSRSPAGESRGSLIAIKDGAFSFSESTALFGGAFKHDIQANSDGRRLRVSGASGDGASASIVDTPKNMNENLLMSFIQNGWELESVLGPMSEGSPVDVESRFEVSGTKLGAVMRQGIIGRKVRALEYTLRDRGNGFVDQVALWIDVESGLPVGRDVVGPRGPNGRMVSSATYEITIDGDSSKAVSEARTRPAGPSAPDVVAGHASPQAESLFMEMEDKLLGARSVEVVMSSNADKIQLAVEAGGRVLVRTPVVTIRNDGARVVLQTVKAKLTQSAAGPPDFGRGVSKAFARGGYRRLYDFVRVGVAQKGFWDETAVSGFRWMKKEDFGGRHADVIQYVFHGRYGNDTTCTLWVDTETRLPIKRVLEYSSFDDEPETEIYALVRLNAVIDSWSLSD